MNSEPIAYGSIFDFLQHNDRINRALIMTLRL